MKNILTLENGVKVDSFRKRTIISSDSVKIILDECGNLVSLECKKCMTEDDTYQETERQSFKDMNEVVTDLVRELGIPANLKGYSYLRTAILLAYEDQSYLESVVSRLYPAVGEIHHEPEASRVERAMRYAIEVVWTRGNVELLNEIFASTINPKKSKITNSEFLATLVDKLKMENS